MHSSLTKMLRLTRSNTNKDKTTKSRNTTVDTNSSFKDDGSNKKVNFSILLRI